MANPLVSIILPVYNSELTLNRSSQSWQQHRVIMRRHNSKDLQTMI